MDFFRSTRLEELFGTAEIKEESDADAEAITVSDECLLPSSS